MCVLTFVFSAGTYERRIQYCGKHFFIVVLFKYDILSLCLNCNVI